MDRSPLADPQAVAAMVAGDPAGLEAAYRRYADRLYGYARSIVDDAEAAADVVQETFVLAQERVAQLRDPARLGSWLYAIARNECLARLRARKRTVMLAESHEPVLDTDPGRAMHAEQVRELVHAASEGMNSGDREVFELTVRHGLSAAEVGQVLGISDKHAHARISRVRAQFEGALGALVLARDTRGQCEQLDGILRDWGGQLTALLRKRIDRHTRDCAVCSARRQERMNPAALLASYSALPFLAVAAQLWPDLRMRLASSFGTTPSGGVPGDPGSAPPGADPGSAPPGPAAVAPGDPAVPIGQPSGGGPLPTMPVHGAEPPTKAMAPPTAPMPIGGGPPSSVQAGGKKSKKGVVVAAALAVLLIIVGAAAVRLLTLDHAPPLAGPSDTSQPAAQSTTTQPPVATSATSAPTQPATTAPTTQPPPTTPAAPFTVTADATPACGSPPAIKITAHAHGAAFDEATVYWQDSSNPSLPMHVDGLLAERQFTPGGSTLTVRWWIVATATDGRTVTTSPVDSVMSCF